MPRPESHMHPRQSLQKIHSLTVLFQSRTRRVACNELYRTWRLHFRWHLSCRHCRWVPAASASWRVKPAAPERPEPLIAMFKNSLGELIIIFLVILQVGWLGDYVVEARGFLLPSRHVEIAYKVFVDSGEILSRVSFHHCQAIQFFRRISYRDGDARFECTH